MEHCQLAVHIQFSGIRDVFKCPKLRWIWTSDKSEHMLYLTICLNVPHLFIFLRTLFFYFFCLKYFQIIYFDHIPPTTTVLPYPLFLPIPKISPYLCSSLFTNKTTKIKTKASKHKILVSNSWNDVVTVIVKVVERRLCVCVCVSIWVCVYVCVLVSVYKRKWW